MNSPLKNNPENGGNGQQFDTSKPSGAKGLASNELYNFLADIEDLVKATNLLTGEELSKAKDELSKRINAAKVSAENAGSQMARRAQKTAVHANHYVHERPWQVVGAGTVIEFLIGYLLARRS